MPATSLSFDFDNITFMKLTTNEKTVRQCPTTQAHTNIPHIYHLQLLFNIFWKLLKKLTYVVVLKS